MNEDGNVSDTSNRSDFMPGGPRFGEVCEHGKLARSCDLCDAMTRIRELESELAAEREAVKVLGKRFYGEVIFSFDRGWGEMKIKEINNPIARRAIEDAMMQWNSRPASIVLLAPHPRCCREAAGPFQSVEGRD